MSVTWTEKLQPGDNVIVWSTMARHDKLRKVERLTKTQVVLEGGVRFNKQTCRECGSKGFYSLRIREATDEDYREIRHRDAADKVAFLFRSKKVAAEYSYDTLTAVIELVEKSKSNVETQT